MMKGSPNMSSRRKINWKGLPGCKTGDTPVNYVPEWALSIHQPIFLALLTDPWVGPAGQDGFVAAEAEHGEGD